MWRRVVVVSGSGLSVSSGMSTFSTPGGLYERAASQAKLANGKSLFCWSFFERRRPDALAFLADVHAEAAAAKPTRGHRALARLARCGGLSRHFTLNIDGLSEKAGMKTWRLEDDPEFNEKEEKEQEKEKEKKEEEEEEGEEEGEEGEQRRHRQRRPRHRPSTSRSPSLPPLDPQRGVTVELHGNVHELVCPDCHRVTPMTETALAALRARVDLPCVGCLGVVSDDDDDENDDGDDGGDRKKKGVPSSSADATGGPLRLRVMLYDDAQGDAITPDEVLDLLEADVATADAVLWVGLSFEQSATTSYFRKVRAALQAVGRCPGAAEEGIGARDGKGGTRGRGRGRGWGRGGGGGGGRGGTDESRRRRRRSTTATTATEGEEAEDEEESSDSPSPSPSRSPSPSAKKPLPCLQAIINPAADDAAFNLLSSCHNRDGIDVLEVRCSSDVALEELAKVLCRGERLEEAEQQEEAKKEEAETAARATTAEVAADASVAAAAAAPPPQFHSSSLAAEIAGAGASIAAVRAKARSSPAAAAAAAPSLSAPPDLCLPAVAAPPAAASNGGAPFPPPPGAVAPVSAAFDSAPPLSEEEETEKEGAAAAEKWRGVKVRLTCEMEASGGGTGASAPFAPVLTVEEAERPAFAPAAPAAAETITPAKFRLTCTSEAGDDESASDGEDEKGIDGEH